MFDKRFEGWYYKQSNGDITVAFIPGEADDGEIGRASCRERV